MREKSAASGFTVGDEIIINSERREGGAVRSGAERRGTAPTARTNRHLLFLLHLRDPSRTAPPPAARITSIYAVYAYNVIGRVAIGNVGVPATSSARPFTGSGIFDHTPLLKIKIRYL